MKACKANAASSRCTGERESLADARSAAEIMKAHALFFSCLPNKE